MRRTRVGGTGAASTSPRDAVARLGRTGGGGGRDRRRDALHPAGEGNARDARASRAATATGGSDRAARAGLGRSLQVPQRQERVGTRGDGREAGGGREG